ncbi:hypothetical protein Tco_0738452 [Tanacetum coccineum]
MLDTHQFTYTVDMFRDSLQLPVETPENPFVAPANIHTTEAFMNRVGYQGVVDKTKINIIQLFHAVLNQTHVDYDALLWWDFMNNVFQKKEAIQYPRFIKLIVADLMKKFPNIPKRLEEYYHSIKDDVPLVSVYITGNVLVREMLIMDALLTAKIRETDDFKVYETVFMKEEIDKLLDGDEDEESYASAFADSVINNDNDDTGSKLEPGSHKEHPEHMSDDDEKKKKDEEVEKEKEVVEIVKETNVDNTSAKKNKEVVTEKEVVDMSGNQEIRNEQMQTPIPSPIRSPRNVSFSGKTTTKEFTDNISLTTATKSKTSVTPKQKKRSFTLKIRSLPGSIAGMCRRRGLIRSYIKTKFITREFFVEKIQEVIQHYDKIIPELTVTKMNEMLKKEMPRLVKLAVNKDREVSPVDISGMNTTLNLYPKTNSSTANTSSADLQQQLYLNMKTKPQDQAVDPEIWEILKAKFEKP